MKTHATKAIRVLLVAGLIAMAWAGDATANPAPGTNDDLLPDGRIYIPLQPTYSGVLGDPLGGGKYVGLQSDTVLLTALHPVSVGSVLFELVFDVSSEIGAGESVDPATAVLLLNFTDLDFKPSGTSALVLRETLTISFRADAGGPTSGTTLTLDETNYGFYSGGVFGETNNATVAYEISLADDLHILQADFDNISADHEFALLVAMGAQAARIGSTGVSVTNSSENIANSFLFAAVPEPGTMILLAVGGGLLAVRRRRA